MRRDSYKPFAWIALFILLIVVNCIVLFAQQQWPRTIEGKNGAKVTMYQPQPENLNGNKLVGRAAISVKQKSTDDPVFGAMWFTATMSTNRDTRIAVLESIKINEIKISGIDDTAKINKLKSFIEAEVPKWKFQTTIDEILASIEKEQGPSSANLKNDPPKIIYATSPSTLVTIDGEPKLQDDDKLKMKRVTNTAFLIIQYPKDNQYYLYGGKFWFTSAAITTGWASVKKLPSDLQQIDAQIKEQEKKNKPTAGNTPTDTSQSPPAVIVSTEPAELIQSAGEANFASISGTQLLYLKNSEDHIFMDIASNKYFVLLSGRWYTAAALKGPWTFVASDGLPADFAKIPEGSDQDIVLANVAGTEAAKEAVMDAQIPQTAKVDKSKATCTVKYDGEPKFEKIEGTSLALAVNTSSTVVQSDKSYYCVENGVWFKSDKPTGPWKVSDERPKDVEKIPASSPAYNVQYVYIYDSTPQYVYVGYTPAYMGCYVYGGVVVYGTGYYYSPWYGPHYYPRPVTYGYSMHYNPYTGWSMGFHYSTGYFSFHYYSGGYHGYWGPPMYRPPYYPPYHGGMYGRGPTYINGDVNINVDRSNNVYGNRNGVSTNDIKRGSTQQNQLSANTANKGTKQSSTNPNSKTGQPSNMAKTQPNKNNVVTDKQGNVYQRSDQGNWQQRSGNSWQPSNNSSPAQLDKQMDQRQRGQERNTSYNQTNRGGNLGGGSSQRSSTSRSGGRRK